MIETPNRFKGDLWAVISALTTGGGLAIAKIILRDIPPLTLNAYVFFFGAVIILCDAAINRKIKETLIVTRSHLLFFFVLGLVFSASTLCLFTALSYTEPATVSFLSRLELVMTLLLAMLFLRERIARAELFGLVFVVAGIIVLGYGASLALSRAILLVSIEALLIGSAEVAIKARIGSISIRSLIFYRSLFMVMVFLIVGHFTGQFVWVTSARLLGLLLLAGLFLPYLGRMGYLKAMERINISRASIIVQSQPFFAGIITLAIIGTIPSVKELSGGLLIVAGVITIKALEKKASRNTLARTT